MKKFPFLAIALAVVVLGAITGFASKSQENQITRTQLREMLVQLGWEVTDIVKDAGKEKYSVKFTKNELDIPVGFEISPSNSYVWLTVNLGDAPKEPNAKCLELLRQNGKVQPTFFYITESGRLMAALAVENRGITNAVLRTRAETVSDNVGKTKTSWQG
ncbi:MAG TPA: PepSY domain-containing protein [Fimbriimonadaceae bacterium]|nr:PepSY domain-containing protein [Fimbriimonadaceae bacterium]